jgi:hypothetical protein
MARNLLTKKSIKFGGESREKVQRVPFGLGAPPGDEAAAQKCLRCGFGNVPVVEEVVWTIPLPLTPEEAQTTFGDTVNPLSGSSAVPGVASIDSTFLINGILQTDILAQGIGVHVFCEPMTFSTIGNAFVAPDVQGSTTASPDVVTFADVNNGALGGDMTFEAPAVFEWGAATWRAGWNFINAYQFQWKTSQRELVLNELAADISYFGSFADAEASGTSELPIAEFVALVNATYRAKDSATIFVGVTHRRVGSVTTAGGGGGGLPPATGNVGIFHPTRDFDLAPVTWGGLRWQGYGCRGQMYRPVESPCFLERGIPIGMIFIAQDAVHQAQMIESLTIDNEPFGINVLPDINMSQLSSVGTPGVIAAGAVGSSAANLVMLEQTLDSTPAYATTVVNTNRQVFKGGILKLGIKIKGWEMPGGWKAYCSEKGIRGLPKHNEG